LIENENAVKNIRREIKNTVTGFLKKGYEIAKLSPRLTKSRAYMAYIDSSFLPIIKIRRK
jgi:predicted GNAT superfamily acetyltransferase